MFHPSLEQGISVFAEEVGQAVAAIVGIPPVPEELLEGEGAILLAILLRPHHENNTLPPLSDQSRPMVSPSPWDLP